MQFLKPGTTFDFVGKRKYAAVVSVLLVISALALFFVKGPNWGIDFTGGTEITLDFDDPTSIAEVREAMGRLELDGDSVQQIGGEEESKYTVRIQDATFGTAGLRTDVEKALVAKFGDDWIADSEFDAQIGARMLIRYNGPEVAQEKIQTALSGIDGAMVQESPDDNTVQVKLPGVTSKVQGLVRDAFKGKEFGLSIESVGPKVGDELRRNGVISILATLALVLVYVGFRFELAFAPGAVLALFHDVVIVAGVFVITRHQFNLPMIGAMLTIIGYSLNDTIVIYDRIRENMRRYRRADTERLINDSINETLTRTLATSFTTLVAMLAFLFLGGPVIETFALAIAMGVIVGTYSTVFVASPTILLMEDVKPHLEKLFAPSGAATSSDLAAEGEGESGELTASERRRQERRRLREEGQSSAT
jgi:preprotein translocase subunit SecF